MILFVCITGVVGSSGSTGSTGASGPIGISGPVGTGGTTGATGSTGQLGFTGATGAVLHILLPNLSLPPRPSPSAHKYCICRSIKNIVIGLFMHNN